jgi:prevent-host-death family protein
MAKVDTEDLISISEAAKVGLPALVRAVEDGHERVLLRNNKPVAAIVSIDRLDQLQQIEDDLWDATLVAARMLMTGPDRHSLDEVLAQFGFTREQLAALPD